MLAERVSNKADELFDRPEAPNGVHDAVEIQRDVLMDHHVGKAGERLERANYVRGEPRVARQRANGFGAVFESIAALCHQIRSDVDDSCAIISGENITSLCSERFRSSASRLDGYSLSSRT